MAPTWMLWVVIACAMGYIVVGRRPRQDSAGRWKMERQLDALLAHHGITYRRRLPDEAQRLLDAGRKIDAVKAYRQATGAGLKDAYDTICDTNRVEKKLEALVEHLKLKVNDDLPSQVSDLMRSGRKIEAIKALRAETGMGLAEAKAMVETQYTPAGR